MECPTPYIEDKAEQSSRGAGALLREGALGRIRVVALIAD